MDAELFVVVVGGSCLVFWSILDLASIFLLALAALLAFFS